VEWRARSARMAGRGRRGELVCPVYLVYLVCLVGRMEKRNQRNKLKKPDEQERRTTSGEAKIGYLAAGWVADSMAARIFTRDSRSNSCP
jgi:hypothetical protein